MKFDAQGWLDDAVEIDYLNKSMSREGYVPTHIVLHGTAGGTSAQAIANYFALGGEPASAHFIIGQDGAIVQGVPCSLAAWGNGILNNPRLPFDPTVNPNWYTISIEHCKPSLDNSDTLTPAQQSSSFRLVQAICDHYNIPTKRGDASGGIIEHADLDSVSRARCPGPYPWDGLLAFLNGGSTMVIPDGWKYDQQNNILTAPNNIQVQGDFATYVLTHAWRADDWPERIEQVVQQLEVSHPGLGGGNWQPFKTRVLEKPTNGTIIEMYAGRELLATRIALYNATMQIRALQQQIQQLQQASQGQANEALKDYTNRLNQIAQIARIQQ